MPRGSEEENDGADSVEAASSKGAWAGRRRLETLPILVGATVLVCVLCGHNSGEKNPLLMADESGDEESPKMADASGPFWPWAGYKECTDDKGVPHKMAKRKLCRICKMIFHGVAFLSQVGTMSNYVKKITETQESTHRS